MKHSDSPSGETDTDKTLAGAVDQVVTPDANGAVVTSDAAVQEQGAIAEPSLDEVIKAAIKPVEAAADTPADSKGSEEAGSDAVTDEVVVEKTEAEKDAEEDAKVPFHKHPRWQKKLEVERDLRAKLTTFEQEAEPLRTKAGQLDQIGQFMVTNSLLPEEMSEGMEIMAMMKNDPARALEMLRPKLEQLEIASGKRFPQDIQERLDGGTIDVEAAKELTVARFSAKANEVRADIATDKLEQTTVQTTQSTMRSAVQTWETELKTRDPDYSHKQSFVIDRTKALAQANPPKTPEDAVALAKQAYDDVTAQMRKFAPAKQSVTTVTSDKSSTRSDPVPQTLADIVRQNIAR